MPRWYARKGPDADVVMSSRIRFARNLAAYPFPSRMSRVQGGEIIQKVLNAMAGAKEIQNRKFEFVDLPSMDTIDKLSLVERRLISPDLAGKDMACGVMISRDESVSIMINEEDHLRIQCMYPGLQLDSALGDCGGIERILEESIEFAFNSSYGYLTSCPTNVGTGLRASVMLHLPALVMTGYLKSVLEACGKFSMAVRGIYGEHTEAVGSMFQVSNQVTLGLKEEDIVKSMTDVTTQIVGQERTLRKQIYDQGSDVLEDKLFRSLGLFSNARIISMEESFRLLSDIRLGIDLGIIKDIDLDNINDITLAIQPATLQKTAGKALSPEERDTMRSEIIREKLASAHR